MKIIDKVCGKIGLMDPEEEKQEQEMDKMQQNQPSSQRTSSFERKIEGVETNHAPVRNVVDFHTAASAREGANPVNVVSAKMKVIVIEPKSFDDAQQVANCLREKRPVVINFENTEAEDAKRIIDFISGTTYALNGEIRKVGRNVFLCAPSNVNVSYTEEEKKVTTEMPWLKK